MENSNYGKFLSSAITLDVDNCGVPTRQDLGIAVVALMITLAKQDNDFEEVEIDVIAEQIQEMFRLDSADSHSMVKLVEPLTNSPGKLIEFIDVVNQNFTAAQKQLVLAMIWRVALANGHSDSHETQFATALRERLGLSLEEAVRARQMAELASDEMHSATESALDEDNESRNTQILRPEDLESEDLEEE
jgi:uncharacterized tellurite resistance protein B-like protein